MTDKTDNHELPQMSLGDHLEELRTRLILAIAGLVVGLVICLCFGGYLFEFLTTPYESAMINAGREPILTVIQPAEAFIVYLKTSLLFGLLVSSPWVFYQLWAFISAGLYIHEKKYVYMVAPLCASLFISGAVFFIMVIAPITMRFFINFNPGVEFLKINWTIKNYVNFVINLTLVFGVAFQMPIAIISLEKLGIIPLKMLTKWRKFVILLLVIIAAIVTPPDVISQISLAVPLYFLYEASIIICRLTKKNK